MGENNINRFKLKVEFEHAPKSNVGELVVDTLQTALSLVSLVSAQEETSLVHLELENQNQIRYEDFPNYWSIRIFSNDLGYCAFHNTGDFKLLIAGRESDISADYIRVEEPIWELIYFLPRTMFYSFEEISKYCTKVFDTESISELVEVVQPL